MKIGKFILCCVAGALGIQARAQTHTVTGVAPAPARPGIASVSPETPVAPQSVSAPVTAAATSGSGVVYTCDPSITALSPGICNTLNTTIANLYNSVFANANANIYIKLGNVALGQSDSLTVDANYSTFRNLL